ncbi:hypothetical protein PanWU01x14_308910 [Parasponia andersonii]|uniref:Hydroxyproline-rich glycoprotein family protein n=1 Tax=Parasponia andersonii TaxID=3476 RepID=A0A2P5AQT8_PARAD|nr:hypothetical protein PanWU01x14_308910 [Parasponia andersonii]
MEPPLSTLVFVVFGFLVSVYALPVESEDGLKRNRSSPPPLSPPPPPLSLPPSSPSPPGSPPTPSSLRPLPPPRPLPPSPPTQLSSKNKSKKSPPPPGGKSHRQSSLGRRPPPPPPPPPVPAPHKDKINAGKKIGLLFSGIAAILQIGVISFLVFKRRQILKASDRYQACS